MDRFETVLVGYDIASFSLAERKVSSWTEVSWVLSGAGCHGAEVPWIEARKAGVPWREAKSKRKRRALLHLDSGELQRQHLELG